ncbi:hypothetical protein [Denitratimonas sp. CY0512]|uniref:hypothetical protein n=1 Tax=Denitratimonas sp. CY0512 TaxID=3131940 RepID=UPI00309613F1
MPSNKTDGGSTHLAKVGELLVEASRISAHKEFVVIGSLSVLASTLAPPARMVMSIDVDFYPRLDPGRASEIARELGPESAFAERFGLYADAVSPQLAALPDGWEGTRASRSMRSCRIATTHAGAPLRGRQKT